MQKHLREGREGTKREITSHPAPFLLNYCNLTHMDWPAVADEGRGEERGGGGDPFPGRSLILSLNEVRADKFDEWFPSERSLGVLRRRRREGDHALEPSTSSPASAEQATCTCSNPQMENPARKYTKKPNFNLKLSGFHLRVLMLVLICLAAHGPTARTASESRVFAVLLMSRKQKVRRGFASSVGVICGPHLPRASRPGSGAALTGFLPSLPHLWLSLVAAARGGGGKRGCQRESGGLSLS